MTRTTFTTLSILGLVSAASANPVNGEYFDVAGCDDHGQLQAFDELGTGPLFPLNELISAHSSTVNFVACPLSDDGTPSALVTMTNLTGQDWTNLFYVADLETRITNVDGVAFSTAAPGATGLAFRIDDLGSNRNLIHEDNPNGIFEAGETWEFIVQNYQNAFGLGAHEMNSLDFAGASIGDQLSSGSIVAMRAIPAPGPLAVAGLGAISIFRRRR